MRCVSIKSSGVTAPHASKAQRRPCSVCTSVVSRAQRVQLVARAAFNPPTVAETKDKFLKVYQKPIAPIYNNVVQELLVQMHFIRFNVNYQYNKIYALGFVSVFEQVLEGIPEVERKKIFNAYIKSLNEDPEVFRKDAAEMESEASTLGGPDGLKPDASGNTLQQTLAKVSDLAAAGKFNYNKFFAIGLFRLLELTGAKEPSALERLVKGVGVRPESVNRDLMLYKGILSKLSVAKELMRDYLERERKKQAEREAEKTAKADKEKAGEATVQA